MCSGHFHGGEKKEGDVPVADPEVDPPVKIDLPSTPVKRASEKHCAKRPRPADKLILENNHSVIEVDTFDADSKRCLSLELSIIIKDGSQ